MIDSAHYIRFLKLWDKLNSEWINFDPWKCQNNWLTLIHNAKKIIGLKKRQVGFSQITGADSLIQCMFAENYDVLVLSKTGDDASVFLQRVRDMWNLIPTVAEYKKLPKEEQHPDYYALVLGKEINKLGKGDVAGTEMVFASGSRITSLSVLKGRGRTADRVVIDEAAFISRQESRCELDEVLKSVEPAIDKADGQLILISTANGINLFHDYFYSAVRRKNNFIAFFVSCWDDPTFTEDKRLNIVKDHGEDHANQEYPRNYREAFLASGNPRFDIKSLDWYKENALIEPIATGEIILTEVVDKLRNIVGYQEKINISDQGYIKFYKPYKHNCLYLIPADVAEGLDHGDYSVAKVLELESGDQVAEVHLHIEPADFGNIMVELGIHYNNALLVPEANNHGISTIQRIKDLEYRNIFTGQHIRERSDDKFRKPVKRYGWVTTEITKKAIIDNLANMILHKEIPSLSRQDIQECMYYIRKNGKTNAQEGHFDDRVMTISIGYYVRRFIDIPHLNEYSSCRHCTYYNRANSLCMFNNIVRMKDQYCKYHDQIDYDDNTIESNTKEHRRYKPLKHTVSA